MASSPAFDRKEGYARIDIMPSTKKKIGPRHKGRRAAPARLSRLHKPEHLTLEAWQTALRKQFGLEQKFQLENVGDHPVFSEFQVTNPQSNNTYRVVIRGGGLGDNYCSCPDFATNTLGTCKHIEFTLAKLRTAGGRKRRRTEAGFQPAYSEVYLQYGARREVRLRPGRDCPAELARLARTISTPTAYFWPEAFARFETFLAEAARSSPTCAATTTCWPSWPRCATPRTAAPRLAAGVSRAASAAPPSRSCSRAAVRLPARRGAVRRPRRPLPASATRWAWARPSRPSPPPRSWPGSSASSACWSSARPRSSTSGSARSNASPTGRSQVIGGLRPRRGSGSSPTEPFFKITNYDTVHPDLDLIAALGARPGHPRRGPAHQELEHARGPQRQADRSPYAIVLTGTPLENRLEELVSIVQFVDRYRLGPTFRLLHEHQMRDEVGKVIGYRDLDRIGKTLAPILHAPAEGRGARPAARADRQATSSCR